jgi:hypothetical protein
MRLDEYPFGKTTTFGFIPACLRAVDSATFESPSIAVKTPLTPLCFAVKAVDVKLTLPN